MLKRLLPIGLLLLASCAEKHAWFEDQTAILEKRTPAKEALHLSDPAGDAKTAFAKGDYRWARGAFDLVGLPIRMTTAESLMGRGMKVVVIQDEAISSKESENYAITYDRTLLDLLKSRAATAP